MQGVKTSVISTTINSVTVQTTRESSYFQSASAHSSNKGKKQWKAHQEAILQLQCPSRTSCNINQYVKINFIRHELNVFTQLNVFTHIESGFVSKKCGSTHNVVTFRFVHPSPVLLVSINYFL